MHTSKTSRQPFTDLLGSFAVRFRIAIPLVFAALVVISLLLAGRIAIVFQATDILNPATPTAREFTNIADTFGSTATIVVAVEGNDVAEMERAADAMTTRIRRRGEMMRYLRSVDLGIPTEYILRWGMTLLPADEIARLSVLLSQPGLVPFLVELNDTLEDELFAGDVDLAGNAGEWLGVELLGRLESFVTTLHVAFSDEAAGAEWGRALVEAFVVGDRFTYTPEKDMLLLYLQPSFRIDDIAATQTIMTLLEELARDVRNEHPGVRIGMGGGVPQNRVQYDALRRDMTVPTLVALVIIVLLFAVSFERVRNILLAVLSLLVGIVLTVGVIALTVGQISIVTSIFAVVLVGLGVDFGIHLVTNFDDYRARGEPPPDAIRHSMRSSAGPIILGGLATAAVFFAVMTSGSPAIREFGFVGGIGILLTLASMMVLLPALLLNVGAGPRATPNRLHVLRYDFLRRVGRGVARARAWVIAAVAVVTVVLALHIPANRISYDLFAMGPASGPTMDTQRRIIEGMGVSPFVTLAMLDSVEEARELSRRLRDDGSVAMTTSVADLLPPRDEVDERLDAIRASLAPRRGDGPLRSVPFTTADVRMLADEIQRLEWNIIEAADLSAAALGPGNRILRRRDTMIREIIGAQTGAPGREVFQRLIASLESDPERSARNLTRVDLAFRTALRDQIDRMSVERAPSLDDIPPDVRAQFVDPTGSRFLVQIIPTAAVQADDESVLAFDRRMTAVHPGITGTLRVYVSLVDEIFGDGWIAARYGGAVVLVLMLVIFRSVRRVALAFGVVVMSIVWMFGLLALFRIPLVMTGALALPLILGIGMAYALHILHRFELERGSIEDTLRYSGKAVFLSSATTGIGFGSLAALGTIGLASGLGYLLLVGIVCCLVGSMVALPALLATTDSRRSRRERDITVSEDGEI